MPVEERDEKNYRFLTNSKRNNDKQHKELETSQSAGFRSFYIPADNSFRPPEKLKSNQQISEVFRIGSSELEYPLLVHFIKGDYSEYTSYPAQTAFTVSKKKFKRAVDRNELKRLMRENYRLLKSDFYEKVQKPLRYRIVFVYIGTKKENFQRVKDAMSKLLDKIAAK